MKTVVRSQAGFTLIELLALIGVVSIVLGLLPAVQRIETIAISMEKDAALKQLGTGLNSFVNGAAKVAQDQAQLTADAVASGQQGTLNMGDLQTLCTDAADSVQAADALLQTVALAMQTPNLTKSERKLLNQAQTALEQFEGGAAQAAAIVAQLGGACASPG